MAKDNLYSLEGKLIAKPTAGFSYFQTAKELLRKLATAKVKGEPMFEDVAPPKIEDEKFSCPLKLNRGVAFTGDVDKPEYEDLSDKMRRVLMLMDLGATLESHFGIGNGMAEDLPENATDAQRKAYEDERKKIEIDAKKRVADMRAKGIIPPAYFTNLEPKDFSE